MSRGKEAAKGVSWCRDGAADLCKRLHQAGVPILVLSAGMGDVLEHVLWYFNIYTDNVKVVSNFFKYNEEVSCVYIYICVHECIICF